MRIVDRKTFLALPAETLFSKFEPCWFGDLMIKGDTLGNDFSCQQIADAVRCDSGDSFVSVLEDAVDNGTSFSLDFECQGRDGLFDDDQLFAVWELEDAKALLDRLVRVVAEFKGTSVHEQPAS